MSRVLAYYPEQSAIYRRDLGEVIVRPAGMPLGRKPRRQESHYLPPPARRQRHSPAGLPFSRSAEADNYRNIGITVKSPAVKTRYRLVTSTITVQILAHCTDM